LNVIYNRGILPKTLFLAGPTPRRKFVESWRPQALAILEGLGFDGTVIVPESDFSAPKGAFDDGVDSQAQWEWLGLDRASTIVFWIPRDLDDMPAFTTNVEFGLTVASQKILLGYPVGAPKTGYLKALAERYGLPVYHDLERLLRSAVACA
jgi:hypothetical protein